MAGAQTARAPARSWTFDELQQLARGLVEVLELEAPDLCCIVILSPSGQGERGRFACETNVARGAEVARVCREVAGAIERVS